MPDRTVTCNATSAEMFARLQTRAIREFERGNFLSSFHFDAGNPQKSFLAAGDEHFATVVENCAGGWMAWPGGRAELWNVGRRFIRCTAKTGCATGREGRGFASVRCVI